MSCEVQVLISEFSLTGFASWQKMAELSSGVIRAYIDRGCPPPQDRSVFRVLATKSLGGCKHRFVVFDLVI